MPSANVEEYPGFREYARRYGADEASWARGGIEWRAEQECKAARVRMRIGERARRGRYAELLALEVARACGSRLEWQKVVREHERRITDFEAELTVQRKWPALKTEMRKRATRPAQSTTPTAPTPLRRRTTPAPTPAPAPALPPAAKHPDLVEADRAEARGDVFTASQLRRQVAEVDHAARRRRVEERVRRDEIMFQRLRDAFGERAAERAMGDTA
jgi:hypothetical protein